MVAQHRGNVYYKIYFKLLSRWGCWATTRDCPYGNFESFFESLLSFIGSLLSFFSINIFFFLIIGSIVASAYALKKWRTISKQGKKLDKLNAKSIEKLNQEINKDKLNTSKQSKTPEKDIEVKNRGQREVYSKKL